MRKSSQCLLSVRKAKKMETFQRTYVYYLISLAGTVINTAIRNSSPVFVVCSLLNDNQKLGKTRYKHFVTLPTGVPQEELMN